MWDKIIPFKKKHYIWTQQNQLSWWDNTYLMVKINTFSMVGWSKWGKRHHFIFLVETTLWDKITYVLPNTLLAGNKYSNELEIWHKKAKLQLIQPCETRTVQLLRQDNQSETRFTWCSWLRQHCETIRNWLAYGYLWFLTYYCETKIIKIRLIMTNCSTLWDKNSRMVIAG